MEIASIILSTISLLISIGLVSFCLGKFMFSKTQIQMVPVDNIMPDFGSKSKRPQSAELMDFEEPLDADEENYFKKAKA